MRSRAKKGKPSPQITLNPIIPAPPQRDVPFSEGRLLVVGEALSLSLRDGLSLQEAILRLSKLNS